MGTWLHSRALKSFHMKKQLINDTLLTTTNNNLLTPSMTSSSPHQWHLPHHHHQLKGAASFPQWCWQSRPGPYSQGRKYSAWTLGRRYLNSSTLATYGINEARCFCAFSLFFSDSWPLSDVHPVPPTVPVHCLDHREKWLLFPPPAFCQLFPEPPALLTKMQHRGKLSILNTGKQNCTQLRTTVADAAL